MCIENGKIEAWAEEWTRGNMYREGYREQFQIGARNIILLLLQETY